MSKAKSSNELNLNSFYLSHMEALRRDVDTRHLEGRHKDALDSLRVLLEELPLEVKDGEVKQWLKEIRGIEQEARTKARGMTVRDTDYQWQEFQATKEMSRQLYDRIREPLYEKLHKSGIFTIDLDFMDFHDPSGGRRSR